ncbi:sporulation protein YunB [Mesobacillus harenae]|uniref:sporulation protein YunB n=1 Tax=Mesobacillus harenae TaxID=2213203 RepID=UPI00157FD876|nr:sporulation protein YunB [Mesobacillus harenae]
MAKFGGRLPRRGPLPFRYVFLLTFVFFIFSTAAGLWVINAGLKPTLMSYATAETRKIATLVITKAINKKIANSIDVRELIINVPGPDEGSGSTRILNTEIINRIAGETTNMIERNLKDAERGDLSELEMLTDVEIETDKDESSDGIVYYVPLGQATNNALLGNLGPKIPVKFNAIGNVHSDVKAKYADHGINNVSVEVSIEVIVNVQIIIPFATEVITVKQSIPVTWFVIEGGVPQFYNGGGSTSPSIQLPNNNN